MKRVNSATVRSFPILKERPKADGCSNRQIAAIGCAGSTAHDCLRRCGETGLAWRRHRSLDDATLYAGLYCRQVPLPRVPVPDFAQLLHAEPRLPGITRMLLWLEYKAHSGPLEIQREGR